MHRDSTENPICCLTELVTELVLWAQSTKKRLYQGWKQTSVCLLVIHSTSHHKSLVVKAQLKSCPQFRNVNPEKQEHMFWSPAIFRGHSTREPASIVCNDKQDDLSCILRDHTETGVSPANTGKTRERFWKECRWMGQKGRNYQGINLWQWA